VIEHPEWIVPELTNQLELRRHSDKGRIYRVYPVHKKPRPIPRLDKLDTAGLVAALDSPNGWQRDMAQQMLIWRADEAAVPLLEEMVAGSSRALARLHALCTLDGLGALRPEIVIRGLADEHAGVRRHAVRLSESLVSSGPPLSEALLKLVDDEDAQVRLQLAYSLGEWPDARAGKALVRLAAQDAKEPYMTAAVMSSAVPHVRTMLAELKSGSGGDAARDLADRLRKLAADIKARPELTAGGKEGGSLVRPIEPDRQEVERLLGGIATVEEIRQATDKYSPVLKMYGDPERGKKMFVEATCSTCHRYRDIGEQIGPDLETLIDRSPKTLLVAVIDPNRACIDRYVEYVALTGEGLTHSGMLLEETSNSITLVDAEGKRKVILRKDLDELIFTGRSHMPEKLQAKMKLEQMADLFAFVGGYEPPPKQLAGNHPEVVVRGQDTAFDMPVSAAAIYGEDVRFDARAGCVTSWTSARACVAWTFRNFVMQRTYDVWIEYACDDAAANGPFTVQLSNGQAVEATVAGTGGWDKFQKVRLGQVKFGAGQYRLAVRPGETLGGPLMNLRAVRLVQADPQPSAAPTAPKPKLIRPRPDGSLALRAPDCEARGSGIRLHADFLVWFYKGPEDRAVWSVEVPKPGAYEVWVEWAQIDEYADNPIAVEVENSSNRLMGKLPSTGGWGKFRKEKLGVISLDAGRQRIVLRPNGPTAKEVSDLRGLELVPATGGQSK
jgi:putative heme-binding domain-containing protein